MCVCVFVCVVCGVYIYIYINHGLLLIVRTLQKLPTTNEITLKWGSLRGCLNSVQRGVRISFSVSKNVL